VPEVCLVTPRVGNLKTHMRHQISCLQGGLKSGMPMA
jgi:hypothetical protein